MKKIKVLQFICSTGFYGAERWVLALAKHLDHQKFCCDFVTTQETKASLEVVEKYQVEEGRAFTLPMSGKFDLSVVNRLVELIKEREIDIIHTHGYKSDILGVLAAKKAGIKVVITPHGFSHTNDKKLKLFIWLGCQFFRFADAVAPLSKQLVTDAQKFNVKSNRLVYIQNGVDLSEVEAQRKKAITIDGYDPEVKRVGFVGQMISRKNIKDILDIFELLYNKNNKIKLFLLGDGDARPELESYSAKLSCKDNIEFLGFREDRLEWLQSFDIFVMTSLLEGIPRCLMEAMAMGVPVAAYDIPGIDQLITHNETGLLAKLHDKEKLAQYWQDILFDSEKSEFLSRRGMDFVYQHYSAYRMAQEYEALFSKILKDS
ncbi:glycosyltransferase [Catenovulum sp. 2E275]|uniref:glycosyltransferase n=1 Tax=Catenovulum sp. 2E275 TaxID=2980497 RepID=UPI0021D315D6|nr:glycosyltransferase [Catenovulum sp. 2E275]MCU4675561.1 glycosyltransferase [Catenovulum sp. 2E275]